MADDSKAKGKKRKSYFHNNSGPNKKSRRCMVAGIRGFLCTCNGDAKNCTREAYNVLNEYADTLYPKPEVDNDSTGKDDVEDDLKKEISDLKDDLSEDKSRFNSLSTGVNGCVFIKTELENPVELSHTIMKDISSTKKRKSKYLLRLIPVEVVCKAYLDDIKTAAEKLFATHFVGEATTFAINFNKRNNDNLMRDEVIESLARLVKDRNLEHKADLKNAQLTILVEVMKSFCCLAVVPEFYKLRKYNLIELAKPDNKVDT